MYRECIGNVCLMLQLVPRYVSTELVMLYLVVLRLTIY